MRASVSLTLCCALLGATPAFAQGYREPRATLAPTPSACTVGRVIDGDTVQCTDGRRIRLRGLDTPERGEPGYRTATRALTRRIEGRTVTVVPHHQSYDRIVGDVEFRGRNIGREMSGQGYDRAPGPRPPPSRYRQP